MTETGYKRNVVDYFKKNLTKGYTPESLKWALIEQGYSKIMVESALERANKELSEKAPKLKPKEKPKIRYQLYGADNKPIEIKKPFWKKLFGK